ncbi:uncharacterized protein [Montipora foliosa]|uniref:uncharacterized protein n=1 Tax=Montipora foliosa TaxID=591990 RepID=UPI0035F1B5DA
MNILPIAVCVVLTANVIITVASSVKGSKHRKNPEGINTSELDQDVGFNRSMTPEEQDANLAKRRLTPEKRPMKISLVPQRSSRKHMKKRCCEVGYQAAKRKLFCMVDRNYSVKYRNMEHYGRQRFQYRGTPSRKMRRLMHRLERLCIKTQLKRVFYKCCLDGIYGASKRSGPY